MSTGAAPLVGRAAELDLLADLTGVVDPPRAGSVLLAGDAGIGKSRLLAALASRADAQGWDVVVGHCLDLGGSPVPYLPFTEIAGRLAGLHPEEVDRLTSQRPSLRRLVATGDATGSGPAERGVFFEAVHAALSELAVRRPLLVVVEDLHWADQSTYDLLTFLLTRQLGSPVGLVGSYRSDDLHRRHPLRTVAAGWSRLPGVRRLDLGPLADSDVSTLVVALRPGPLSAEELRSVVDRAEGNAFFVEELAAALGSPETPRDLADLLLLRLDHLHPDARLVVQALAVGGHKLSDTLLSAVTGLDPERFETAVREAVDRNVLVSDRDGYGFRHSMLGEAIEADLLPGQRSRLHAAYVRELAGDGGRGVAADLARHATEAGRPLEAFGASVRAGDEAAAIGGPDEAARHYARALDLVSSGQVAPGAVEPPVDVIGLIEKAAGATSQAGLARRAEALVSAEISRLPLDAAPADRARLLVLLVEVAEAYETASDLVALSMEAERLVPAEPATALRARTVATLAFVLVVERRDVEAVRWAEEGLAMPPELRPGEVTAKLQTVMAKVFERRGEGSESERILGDLAAAARADGDPAEVRLRHQLGAVLLEQGRLPEALGSYRRAAGRSTELGRPFGPYGLDARIFEALLCYQLGRWDEALELAGADSDQVPPVASAALAAVELLVRAGRGARDGWAALLERARTEWAAEGMVAVQSAGAAIDLLGDGADLDGAVAVHDEVVAAMTLQWGTSLFQGRIRLAGLLLGQLAAGVGGLPVERRSDVLARSDELVDAASRATAVGRTLTPGPEGQAWLLRVRAEWLRLRWMAGETVDRTDLVSAWTRCVDAFAAYGHVYEAARSRARLAVALRSVGRDVAAAREAEASAETARALRAQPLLDEVRPLLGRSTGGGPPDVLTPRESEVLALVADGASNRDVGVALFISTKTASVHVSNILAKLGARSRTEAVAQARRRGLLD